MPPAQDGEIVDEYREGCDKCIERRAGPGEDVEVEIVKDAYAHTEFEEKLAEVHERARSALAHAKERLSPSHAKKA